MSEQAQVGDNVRLTITVEGEVVRHEGYLRVCGRLLDSADRTVEILSRAVVPLPSEPGTWWLDNNSNIWTVDQFARLHCIRYPTDKAEEFAPFRQLVLKND